MDTKPIGRYADYLDSRDIIARLTDLQTASASGEELSLEELYELDALQDLHDAASGYLDGWEEGITLLADHYFPEYARELASDCHSIRDTSQWPFTCIDWKEAARELQADYIEFEYRGQTFWARD